MANTCNRDPIASSPPAWILFDYKAHIGDASNHNDSTASEAMSNGKPIEVSLLAARPPVPSRLYVHCPHLQEADEVVLQQPCIVATADDFLLLRVTVEFRPSGFRNMSSWSRLIKEETNDYFIYRPASPEGPSLKRLEDPHPRFFLDFEVALLPRGDHFTVAALSARMGDDFDLHLFKSEDWTWNTKVVVVDRPWEEPFPLRIPVNACRLFQHNTSTAITIGGECGTVGWVDLWRGILLCDLLSENHNLRDVPMPLMQPERLENNEEGIDCCPRPFRGIVVAGNFLKVVELEIQGDRLPDNDPETNGPNFRIHDWKLTTYTKSCKSNITSSWHDWVTDCTVKASEIEISETARSGLLRCGIGIKVHNSDAAERNLQNVYTCQPVPSLDDKGIVYLITRLKFLHPKAWVLAIDMKNNTVQAMARIPIKRSKDVSLAYCASIISSFMHATTVAGGKRCSGNQLEQDDEGEATAAA